MDEGVVWIGLDLGLRRTQVCAIDHSGESVHEQDCVTSLAALQDALAIFPLRRIGLIAVEAGSGVHIVRKLRGAGFPVALFEARKASRFLGVRRNKTDASDARGLADLARLGRNTVSQVHLKSLQCQELRSQLAMRHKVVRLRVAMEGMLRSRLALYGRPLGPVHSAAGLKAQMAEALAQIEAEEGVDLSKDVGPLVQLCESLRSYLRGVDRNLAKEASQHPVCSRLMDVSGVGPICALSFYSAVEEPSRFERTSDVAAYLGLTPRRYQSGKVSFTRGITKTGNKLTRTHLVNAAIALSSRGSDSELKQWATTLQERIGSPRARVAVARKLAILLLTIWKTGVPFEPFPSKQFIGRQTAEEVYTFSCIPLID